MPAESSPPEKGPGPVSAGDWLLESVRRIPWMIYALAVVGVSAAGGISLGFFLLNSLVALYASLAVFAGMLILKAFSAVKVKSLGINIDIFLVVLLWAVVVCIVIMLGLGMIKLGIVMFSSSPVASSPPETFTKAFVRLERADGGSIGGDFTLWYIRDGTVANDVPGTMGVASITDLPPNTSVLKITSLIHPRLKLPQRAKGAPHEFTIGTGGQVTVPVIPSVALLSEPTWKEMLAQLNRDDMQEADVLEEVIPANEISDVKLTLLNKTGQHVVVWLYDCWWCYKKDSAGTKFFDLELSADKETHEFRPFGLMKSTSGICVVFIDYEEGGGFRRQLIGTRKFFSPRDRTAKIGNNYSANDPLNPFTFEFLP